MTDLFFGVLYGRVQTAVRQISLAQLAMHSTAHVFPIRLTALWSGKRSEFFYILPQSLQTNVATAPQIRQRSLAL